MKRTLVLDAMGVIYRVGDDVADLLLPFLRAHGGNADKGVVNAAYLRASLGEIPSAEFWRRVDLDPNAEDAYLATLTLTPGLIRFLDRAAGAFRRIACLSNDVSEWSRKLRERHGLTRRIDPWFISGDLRCRKPSPDIYHKMLAGLDAAPGEIVYVDDKAKNLAPAEALGMRAVLYDPEDSARDAQSPVVARLEDLIEYA